MTVSQPENNNSLWGVRCPTQNVADGRLASQSCSERRSKVQTSVMLMQSWCFAHKGFICSIPVKPSHSIAGIWGPVHTYPDIYFFFKSEVCLSILAFRPHVIGIFGRRRRRFSQMVPRMEILENDVRIDEYRGFRIQHCACSVNGCYRILII